MSTDFTSKVMPYGLSLNSIEATLFNYWCIDGPDVTNDQVSPDSLIIPSDDDILAALQAEGLEVHTDH